jgi:glycosyltransferase involved in cell wall biosynthesis
VNPFRILFVGKLNKLKGLLALGSAIPRVLAAVGRVEVLLVGQDSVEAGVSVKHSFLGMIPRKYHSRIRFVDRLSRNELALEYRHAGVLVLPSYTETQGIVILEAMASGRPVVASNRGGIPEVLEDGSTGILADPDYPQSFAAALLELLQNPEKGHAMGKAGRQLAQSQYAPDILFRRIEEFYTACCLI